MKGYQSWAWKGSITHYNGDAVDLLEATLMLIFLLPTCAKTGLLSEETLHFYMAFITKL